MVASKEVRPLETVLEDLPVVIAPQSQPVCLVCLRKARNLEFPCLQCGFPTCSKECVPSHQNLPECAILSQKPGSAPKCEDDLNQSSIAYASVGVIRFLDFIAESNDPKHTLNNDNNGTAKNPTHRVTWVKCISQKQSLIWSCCCYPLFVFVGNCSVTTFCFEGQVDHPSKIMHQIRFWHWHPFMMQESASCSLALVSSTVQVPINRKGLSFLFTFRPLSIKWPVVCVSLSLSYLHLFPFRGIGCFV